MEPDNEQDDDMELDEPEGVPGLLWIQSCSSMQVDYFPLRRLE